MPVTIGSQLGTYEITELLGKGGMGEVYRAKDKRLKREVAIKVLPEEFSKDHDRVSRFQREAEVLASLNHPNIAAIYDLAAQDQSQFLVLELVDGETLADRIARGPIPVEEALDIAGQICEALGAAHERGVIHRDLKPANIKLTSDGKVKVLDFGLAKAYASQTSRGVALSNSPTVVTNASMPGVIIGTAAYMSPEQAKGKEVDKRTDIFAFGCVLFEMLSGKRAFDGEDVAQIIAHVLTRGPDWSQLPSGLPPRFGELLPLCLEKNPKDRLSDAADVHLLIERGSKEPAAASPPPKGGRKAGWIAAAIATLALLSVATVHFSEKPPSLPEMRLDIATPLGVAPMAFALSPDSRYIAFVGAGDGPQRLWLRALDIAQARPISGTEGADYPFWSPDSRSIGFFANGKLKRIDIAGGSPQALADVQAARGGAWSKDGVILFAPSTGGGLWRVAAAGGDATPVTRVDSASAAEAVTGQNRNGHRFPQFLPDGRHFLFYVLGFAEVQLRAIYVGSLDGGEPKRLTAADSAGSYLAPDMIVFIRGTTLMVQRLDLKTLVLTGDPVSVADPVGSMSGTNASGAYSTSANGRLAYRIGTGSTAASQFVWVERSGKTVGTVGEPDSARVEYPELSPDGQRFAVDRMVQGNNDIWLMDLLRGGNPIRFTFDPALDLGPVWSPDGKQIAFSSARHGEFNIYLKAASGIGTEQPFIETPHTKIVDDWSRDGRFLLYWENDPRTGPDLWAKPLTKNDSKPIAIAQTPFEERNGQFSPDGRWVAYQTNESGRFEIVVQPFPLPTGKFQVSTTGGVQPRWRADGKELYFIASDGKMMASAITNSGGSFTASTPIALFGTRLAPGGASNKQEYAVSKDGRFLLNQLTDAADNGPITLILNWKPPK